MTAGIVEREDAIVLRTWPVHEADLIVSLFTRGRGRLKGMAKAAMKSRRRFGGALEPMTVVRASFVERPRQELVRLEACEIELSPLRAAVSYRRLAALDLYSEILEAALEERAPEETLFRLVLAVLPHTTAEQPWMAATYFCLWVTRLLGWLPEMDRCMACGCRLWPGAGRPGAAAYFSAARDGLFCRQHRPPAAAVLAAQSLEEAAAMQRTPLGSLDAAGWDGRRGADLRRFLAASLERHLERRLRSAAALAQLGSEQMGGWAQPGSSTASEEGMMEERIEE